MDGYAPSHTDSQSVMLLLHHNPHITYQNGCFLCIGFLVQCSALPTIAPSFLSFQQMHHYRMRLLFP